MFNTAKDGNGDGIVCERLFSPKDRMNSIQLEGEAHYRSENHATGGQPPRVQATMSRIARQELHSATTLPICLPFACYNRGEKANPHRVRTVDMPFPAYRPGSIGFLGEAIYRKKVKHLAELTDFGKFVVIAIESRDDEIDQETLAASLRLLKRHSNTVKYGIRICHRIAFSLGGGLDSTDD